MGKIKFDNEFQIKYHKVLMMNELGVASPSEEIGDNAYKLSLCNVGKSGYSFGPCQWDLSNPTREINKNFKIKDLFEELLCKEIDDNSLVEEIKDKTYYHKLKPLEKLKYKVKYNNKDTLLLNLIDKCLSTEYAKTKINDLYLEELREQEKYVNERVKDVLKVNPKIKEFLEDEFIKLSLLDYHNQFNFSKNGKCEKYLKGEKTQKYNSVSTIQIGDGTKVEDWTNYYFNTKTGNENRPILDKRKGNIEKVVKFQVGKNSDIKAPQNFADALKIMMPKVEVEADKLCDIKWVGFKFTNLYELTKEEVKGDNKKIIDIAKSKIKDEKTNLNVIKNGDKFQVLVKKASYEAVISKDEKDKEYKFFYNGEDKEKIYGEVKLAYNCNCHPLNFVAPSVKSPVIGVVTEVSDVKRILKIEEIQKNQDNTKYFHVFKNIVDISVKAGDKVELGKSLGKIGTCTKDFEQINLNYSIERNDTKASVDLITIDPVEFWNTGKSIGFSFTEKANQIIIKGKIGEITSKNDKESILYYDQNTSETEMKPQILIDGYRIGHYAELKSNNEYEEKEILFNRSSLQTEKKGLSVTYKYEPNKRELSILASGKEKLIIKNFKNGYNGIYLENLVINGDQIIGADEEKEEEGKAQASRASGNHSTNASKSGVYVATGASASCPLGGKIRLVADGSKSFSGGKMLLNSSHIKPSNLCGAGVCNISRVPPPCMPTPAGAWVQISSNFLIDGKPALTDKSKIVCAKGGLISITSPGQNTYGYGSTEAKLLLEKSKEDEQTVKDQQEGKKVEEKPIAQISNIGKTVEIPVKKEIEVEQVLTLERNRVIETIFEEKSYKLFIGKLIDESGNVFSDICCHADEKGENSILPNGRHKISFGDDNSIKIGEEFIVVDYTKKDNLYKSNKHLIVGNELTNKNSELNGNSYGTKHTALRSKLSNHTEGGRS